MLVSPQMSPAQETFPNHYQLLSNPLGLLNFFFSGVIIPPVVVFCICLSVHSLAVSLEHKHHQQDFVYFIY